MNLNFNVSLNRTKDNELSKDLIQNFHKYIESFKNDYDTPDLADIRFTQEEDLEYYRKEFDFLESFFDKELADTSHGEAFIVTNRYNSDRMSHRYKVTQYKNSTECKYVVSESVLPIGVKLNDIVRKVGDKYYYDEQATKYVNDTLNKFKQEILDKRNT